MSGEQKSELDLKVERGIDIAISFVLGLLLVVLCLAGLYCLLSGAPADACAIFLFAIVVMLVRRRR